MGDRVGSFYEWWFDWIYRHPVVGPLPGLFAMGLVAFGLFASTGTSFVVCAVLATICCVLLPYPFVLAYNWRGVRQRRAFERAKQCHSDEADPGAP